MRHLHFEYKFHLCYFLKSYICCTNNLENDRTRIRFHGLILVGIKVCTFTKQDTIKKLTLLIITHLLLLLNFPTLRCAGHHTRNKKVHINGRSYFYLFIVHILCGSAQWQIYSSLTTTFCVIENVLDIKVSPISPSCLLVATRASYP